MKTMKRIIPFTILILAAVILFVVWFRAYVPVKSEHFTQTEAKSNLEKIPHMKSVQIHMDVLYSKIRQKP